MRPCARSGCPAIVDRGYCDACRPFSEQAIQERRRGSAASRGYDRHWQRFRTWYLARHRLCQDCEAKPIPLYVAATDVHHVKKVGEYPELKLVEDNCMALCHECHSARTFLGQ